MAREAARPGAGGGGRGHPHDVQPAVWPSAGDRSPQCTMPVVGAMRVPAHEKLARFEQAVLPHLAAAYNLARWLTRDAHHAEDVV